MSGVLYYRSSCVRTLWSQPSSRPWSFTTEVTMRCSGSFHFRKWHHRPGKSSNLYHGSYSVIHMSQALCVWLITPRLSLINTRCNTPKRVTSWRDRSPRHCARVTQLFEETPQRWRAVGNIVSDLTGPRFEPQTSSSRDERATTRPTGRFPRLSFLFGFCLLVFRQAGPPQRVNYTKSKICVKCLSERQKTHCQSGNRTGNQQPL